MTKTENKWLKWLKTLWTLEKQPWVDLTSVKNPNTSAPLHILRVSLKLLMHYFNTMQSTCCMTHTHFNHQTIRLPVLYPQLQNLFDVINNGKSYLVIMNSSPLPARIMLLDSSGLWRIWLSISHFSPQRWLHSAVHKTSARSETLAPIQQKVENARTIDLFMSGNNRFSKCILKAYKQIHSFFLSSVLSAFLHFYSSQQSLVPSSSLFALFSPHISLIHSSSACKAVEFQLWTRDWNGNKGEQKSRLHSSSTRSASWLEKLGRKGR